MDQWHFYLAAAFLTAVILSLRDRFALIWLAAIATEFTVCDTYARSGLPYPEAMTFAGDTVLVIALYLFGRRDWDSQYLRLIFQASMAIGIARTWFPAIVSHHKYTVALEWVNYAALFTISVLPFIRGRFDRPHRRRTVIDRLLRSIMAIHAPRKEPPFFHYWRRG